MNYPSVSNEKTSVAISSIAAALVVTGLKIVVGLWTGSLGILSEAAHSGLDLIAAIITYIAVKISDRPADKTHLYGHGKIENFSALIETLLLLLTCTWIIREAIIRLFYHSIEVEVNFWSFFVILLSIVVDYSRSRALSRAASKHQSQALEADALHFGTDMWSSGVVLFGLIMTLANVPVADSIAALIVALIVIIVSFRLGKRTIDGLMDRAPMGMEERIENVARAMDGVENVDNIRVRTSGPKTFVDLTLYIRRTMPFEVANTLVHNVEKAIQKFIPRADIVIHPEPTETSDETIVDKIKLMMSGQGLIAHDVEVFKMNGEYQVEFHLEFQERENFVTVHAFVDEVETRIKKEFPLVSSVIVHIEDSKEHVFESVNVTYNSRRLIKEILALVANMTKIDECEILSVLDVKGKYRVSMRCTVDRGLPLEDVHSISTSLENKIMVAFPQINEVNIHAEPSR